ncbi:MAG: phage holin family protein [Alphaproteobacteria bacterium]
MSSLNDITAAVANNAMEGLRLPLRRLSLRLCMILVASLLIVGGLFALCWTLIVALREVVPDAWAGIAAASLLFGIAGLLWLVAWRMKVSPVPRSRVYAARDGRHPPSPSTLEAMAAETGEALGAQVRENPKSVALIALAAGVALGASPKLRRKLLG